MATPGDKSGTEHVDNIASVSSPPSTQGAPLEKQDTTATGDEIIQNLATAGEEVGMTWRSILAAGAMASAYNAYVFTLLIPPAVLSLINADLGPSPNFTWITISWNLGGAIFVTVGGRLSDLFGRRWFFIAGSATLVVGSIIGATGQSIPQMIACGAVYGAGSGFLEMAYGAVQEIVPNRYRMVTIGVFDTAAVIAQASPLFAWAMIKGTGNWRNCYYLLIGFHVLNLAYIYFAYHPPKFETKNAASGRTRMQILRDFDWIGMVIFVAGCTLFIIGVNWGGSLHPWTSAATLTPIILGLGLIVALGFYEVYGNVKEPLLPPRLFKHFRQFVCPIIVVSIVGMQYYSNATLWPRLSQLLYATGPISRGLYSCVIPLGSILGGIYVVLCARLQHQRWQILGAIAVQTACVGAMSTATMDDPVKSVILTFFVSFCVTIIMMNCFVLIGFGISNQDDIGTAAGLAGTARLMFGAVAVAIFSNVTNNRYASELVGAVTRQVEGLNFPSDRLAELAAAAQAGTPEAYDAVDGATEAVRAAATIGNKQAYLVGARLAYQVALAFGLLGCIAALFIPSVDRRKLNNRTVAVQEKDLQHLGEKKLDGDHKA